MNLPSLLFESIYEFSPAVKAALASGQLKQVVTVAGQLLPIAHNPSTGAFVEIAKAGTRLAAGPVIAIAEFASSAIQTGILSTQMDRGFQKTYREITAVQEGIKSLQSSVAILQGSTALIGVGTVAGVALSAVNLYQMFKLREDIKKLRLEVKDGFIDLKLALQGQEKNVLKRLDEVANDLKFHSQKLLMIKAYGQFREAARLIGTALACSEASTRNDTLAAALSSLTDALATYNSPELFVDTSAVGSLRRMECVWAIEQSIALIYQLWGEPGAVSERLWYLRQKIQSDSLLVVNQCECENELDLLFPELTRIHQCDLAVLEMWQEQIEWCKALPARDRKQLTLAKTVASAETDVIAVDNPTKLPEEVLYGDLKQASHFLALRDQLRFVIKPELRGDHESYIEERSQVVGFKALAPSNWQEVSDLAVANIYWYLKRSEYPA
jgi:hypothetical protein